MYFFFKHYFYRDLSKAIIFLRNALAILQSVNVDDVHAKYRSVVLYHLSVVLRIRGSLVDAKSACDVRVTTFFKILFFLTLIN